MKLCFYYSISPIQNEKGIRKSMRNLVKAIFYISMLIFPFEKKQTRNSNINNTVFITSEISFKLINI